MYIHQHTNHPKYIKGAYCPIGLGKVSIMWNSLGKQAELVLTEDNDWPAATVLINPLCIDGVSFNKNYIAIEIDKTIIDHPSEDTTITSHNWSMWYKNHLVTSVDKHYETYSQAKSDAMLLVTALHRQRRNLEDYKLEDTLDELRFRNEEFKRLVLSEQN